MSDDSYLLPPLIGLIGAAGAGKDEVADYLERTYRAIKYSSSDPIKEVFKSQYSWGQTDRWKRWACHTQEGKASPHPYLTTSDGTSLTNRAILEMLGDGMNAVDSLVLMRPMPRLHEETGRTIVDTSTREDDQAQFIRANGGVIVYVQRASAEQAAGKHHTAQFYQTCPFNYVLDNNGTIEELHTRIDKLVRLMSASYQTSANFTNSASDAA